MQRKRNEGLQNQTWDLGSYFCNRTRRERTFWYRSPRREKQKTKQLCQQYIPKEPKPFFPSYTQKHKTDTHTHTHTHTYIVVSTEGCRQEFQETPPSLLQLSCCSILLSLLFLLSWCSFSGGGEINCLDVVVVVVLLLLLLQWTVQREKKLTERKSIQQLKKSLLTTRTTTTMQCNLMQVGKQKGFVKLHFCLDGGKQGETVLGIDRSIERSLADFCFFFLIFF